MGIDIVVKNNDIFYAVQCKYKKSCTLKKNILSWKQLSTFYAICMRTGPFDKYIVMMIIYLLYQFILKKKQ